MKTPSVLLAAVAAALLATALPPSAEGASGHRKGPSVQRKAGAKDSVRASRKGRKRVRSHRPSSSNGVKHRRKARRPIQTRPIHQNGSASVVLDRVEVRTADYYGPFLPFEAHDYPQPPCPAVDVVLLAHVHDQDEDTPESPDPPGVSPPSDSLAGLAHIARRFGSLFRPKSAQARVRPEDVDLPDLLSADLEIPVEGVDAEKLRDSFLESRGRHAKHLAIDIGAPRGAQVIATADGEIVRLTRERRGGISIYQKDTSGRYLFFYCHLSRYAEGLQIGQQVRRGEPIGYVGSTGRVIGGPHLHFSVTRLPDDDDNFREGLAINPYLLFLAGVP